MHISKQALAWTTTSALTIGLALSLTACGSKTATSSSATESKSASGHIVLIGGNIPEGPALKGSGTTTTAKRTVDQFHALEFQDRGRIQVTVGMPLEVTVQADDNLQDAIDTKVKDGKLTVSVNKDFQTEHSPYISVSVPELSEIVVSGPGEVLVNAVKGDIFNVSIPGSGSCSAAGKIINEKISISGSGSVDASKLTAENVTVDHSGSGDCKVTTEKSMTAKVSGSGKVQYKGNPQSLNKDVTGSGSITAMPQ